MIFDFSTVRCCRIAADIFVDPSAYVKAFQARRRRIAMYRLLISPPDGAGYWLAASVRLCGALAARLPLSVRRQELRPLSSDAAPMFSNGCSGACVINIAGFPAHATYWGSAEQYSLHPVLRALRATGFGQIRALPLPNAILRFPRLSPLTSFCSRAKTSMDLSKTRSSARWPFQGRCEACVMQI